MENTQYREKSIKTEHISVTMRPTFKKILLQMSISRYSPITL
jgi:hypothetical protein